MPGNLRRAALFLLRLVDAPKEDADVKRFAIVVDVSINARLTNRLSSRDARDRSNRAPRFPSHSFNLLLSLNERVSAAGSLHYVTLGV